MIKRKGAAAIMVIILVSVCGWVSVIGLVIKPDFWVGSILSIVGGIAIGAGVAYLMKKWWVMGIQRG